MGFLKEGETTHADIDSMELESIKRFSENERTVLDIMDGSALRRSTQ